MRRTKMGRPRVSEKGYVYTFYAPPKMMRKIEDVMRFKEGSVSDFLREAVNEKLIAIQAGEKDDE